MRQKIQLIPLLAALAFLSACGTLDPSGPYKGNKVLYDADQVIATSYDLLHTFVTWEFQNRAALASQPEVTKYADYIRVNAPKWFTTAVALRDTYKTASTSANASALSTALQVLQTAVAQATGYLATQPMPAFK